MSIVEEYWIKDSIKNETFDKYYEIINKIGDGATCTVYCCVRRRTDIKFAVKVISKKMNKKIVKTEVGVLLKLNHPNNIRLYEVYESPSEVHMILEYVSGGELFESIVSRGFYSEKDASQCVRQMLEAVSYLHDNDIIHRDLKPENLLYKSPEDSTLKLADFGIAKILEDDVHTMTVCGTPGYCAPEILLGTSYGKPVDLWSIGVITYILLCGFEPFFNEKDNQMFHNIIKGNYAFVEPWWTDVSLNAKDLISRLLITDPSKRLTAKQALNHIWVKGEAAKNISLEETQNKLKEFNLSRRKMKASVLVTTAIGHMMKMCNIPSIIQDSDPEVVPVCSLESSLTFTEGMNPDSSNVVESTS